VKNKARGRAPQYLLFDEPSLRDVSSELHGIEKDENDEALDGTYSEGGSSSSSEEEEEEGGDTESIEEEEEKRREVPLQPPKRGPATYFKKNNGDDRPAKQVRWQDLEHAAYHSPAASPAIHVRIGSPVCWKQTYKI
jgi:hypothetical protein